MKSQDTEKRSLGSRIAIAISLVALFAALGGGAYAASQIGSKDIKKNAVKSKQIKAGAVKNAELADGSVTAGKLAAGAVDATKIADGSIGTGKLADGAVTGAKAGAGVLRDMIVVEDREPNTGFTTGETKQAFPNCPEGYVVTGGGGRILGDDGAEDIIIETDLPIVERAPGLQQWFIQASDAIAGDDDDWALTGTAVCVRA